MHSEELKKMISEAPFLVGSISTLSDNSELPEGRLSVEFPGGTIESFYVSNKSSPYLYVLFSGARDPNKHSLPKFDRWTWAEKFDASILCISDPTLALDQDRLNIGWYLGTENNDYLTHIATWVNHVASRLGILKERIISYGSSAGGFASIMLAGRLRKSVAIAINPQLDVFKYYPKFVDQYFELAFPGKEKNTLSTIQKSRFSAIHTIASSPDAKFIIAQNIQDKFHYTKHFGSLVKELNLPTTNEINKVLKHRNVTTLLFDSPNGHGAEPLDIVPILVCEAKS